MTPPPRPADPTFSASPAGPTAPAVPTGPTPNALLAAALAADPARPLLTFTDDATGERTELSVATFANWVAKTANLLEDEVAPDPGGVVALALPVHWQAAVWLSACWVSGHPVRLGPATDGDAVAVVAHDPGDLAADREVLAPPASATVVSLGLGPLGLPRPGVLPAYDQALDYDREVHGHGDRFAPVTPAGAGDIALLAGGRTFTHAELGGLAVSAAPPGGALLVTEPLVDLRTVLATLLVPLAAGGRALLCRNLGVIDEARLPDRVSQEGVVAVVTGRSDTPADERTVTGVLPEWNGPAAGMA